MEAWQVGGSETAIGEEWKKIEEGSASRWSAMGSRVELARKTFSEGGGLWGASRWSAMGSRVEPSQKNILRRRQAGERLPLVGPGHFGKAD